MDGVENTLPVELRHTPWAPLIAAGVAGAPALPFVIVTNIEAVQP